MCKAVNAGLGILRRLEVWTKAFGRLAIVLVMLMSIGLKSAAQVDPTLAAMIMAYTEKAERSLKSQERAMLLETTGHVWIKEEMNEVYNLQKQYNDYLDSFRSIIVYAAQVYGFYHEIGKMAENLGHLTEQIAKSPGNAIATALSTNRNKIYTDVIMGSLDICRDIRYVCFSGIKMTEKERIQIVFGIRPKLRMMNQKLRRLALTVKYTTLGDVWREIDGRAREMEADKDRICGESFQRWMYNGNPKRRWHGDTGIGSFDHDRPGSFSDEMSDFSENDNKYKH